MQWRSFCRRRNCLFLNDSNWLLLWNDWYSRTRSNTSRERRKDNIVHLDCRWQSQCLFFFNNSLINRSRNVNRNSWWFNRPCQLWTHRVEFAEKIINGSRRSQNKSTWRISLGFRHIQSCKRTRIIWNLSYSGLCDCLVFLFRYARDCTKRRRSFLDWSRALYDSNWRTIIWVLLFLLRQYSTRWLISICLQCSWRVWAV